MTWTGYGRHKPHNLNQIINRLKMEWLFNKKYHQLYGKNFMLKMVNLTFMEGASSVVTIL